MTSISEKKIFILKMSWFLTWKQTSVYRLWISGEQMHIKYLLFGKN